MRSKIQILNIQKLSIFTFVSFIFYFLFFIFSAPLAQAAGGCANMKTPAPASGACWETCTPAESATNCATGQLWMLGGCLPATSCAFDSETAGGATTESLPNPLGITDIPTLIGNVIKALLGITGSIALLMFVYGGLLWLSSGGNEKRVEKGKQVLTWATIGLGIIFTSYILVNFVIQSLTKK